MLILGWTLFAFVNLIILVSLDYNPDTNGPFQTSLLGIIGALGSSLLLYFIFNGITKEFALTLSLITILEGFLLVTMLFAKSFGNVRI